ncbi:hypothetical protein AALH30_03545 [Blautia pseudococcoides]|uniref:hypothetical protein n=1 Tax=Blautia pseudococcoides TaxID=1796616 RepID=UPI00148B2CBE|nr:hypothetical protein [Blautia pseudococcoides]QJU13851.1 hypothetical protein HL650_04825 [Blautia pseudococcoides]
MYKLVKLEWKKNIVRRDIKIAFLLMICLLLLTVVIGEITGLKNLFGYDEKRFFETIEAFCNMAYTIMTGIMLEEYIVNGYENRRLELMYLYPIKRWKVLLSQIISVVIFNVGALIIAKFLIYFIAVFTQGLSISCFKTVSFYINEIGESMIMISACLLALGIGMRLKSAKAVSIMTLVLSLGILREMLNGEPIHYIVLFIFSIVAVPLIFSGIEKADI